MLNKYLAIPTVLTVAALIALLLLGGYVQGTSGLEAGRDIVLAFVGAVAVILMLLLAILARRARQTALLQELDEQIRSLAGQPRGDRCVSVTASELAELARVINALVAEADGKATELEVMTERLARLNRDLYEVANTDPLTGLANRPRFFDDLTQQLAQAGRYQHNLCIAVFDVDMFKQVNDEHGYAAGDKVLQDLAVVTRAALRDSDLVARIGSEEFALVMPETPHGGAVALCERVRRDFERRIVAHEGAEIRYQCSFGVTGYQPESDTPDTLLGRGYASLRLAKESGRNRVIAN